MPRTAANRARKLPTQERSRATVDAILQATAYILVKRGWHAMTTNAIAERAGVNIASLYQFFPNKEAIVSELERRHVEETRAKMAEVYLRHRGESLQERIRTLIEAVVAAHMVAPQLHRVFAERLPRGGQQDLAAEPGIVDAVAELFTRDLPDPNLVAWMIATVAHAAVHHGVIERSQDMKSGALIDELVALLVRYLECPRKPRS
jgi:AcrR family transcriptional regulator